MRGHSGRGTRKEGLVGTCEAGVRAHGGGVVRRSRGVYGVVCEVDECGEGSVWRRGDAKGGQGVVDGGGEAVGGGDAELGGNMESTVGEGSRPQGVASELGEDWQAGARRSVDVEDVRCGVDGCEEGVRAVDAKGGAEVCDKCG